MGTKPKYVLDKCVPIYEDATNSIDSIKLL